MQYYNNSPLDTHVCIFILTCYYFTDSYKNIRTDRDNLSYCDHHAYNIFSLLSLHYIRRVHSHQMKFIFSGVSQLPFGIFGEKDSGLYIFGTPTTEREDVNFLPLPKEIHQRNKISCSQESCPKTPSFGTIGSKPVRCGTHRQTNDINVRHRLCSHEGCTGRARYGETDGTATHCGFHRTPGSSNLTVRHCVFKGCTVIPRYCPPGKSRPERCSVHKLESDTIVSREACESKDCFRRPCFVNKGSGEKHCIKHYNPKTDVGILYLICQEKGCVKYATFSQTKNKPLKCLMHKSPEDRDVVNPSCETDGCSKRPSFAPMGSRAKRCKTHSLEGDLNVNGIRCSHEGCNTMVDSKRKSCKVHS